MQIIERIFTFISDEILGMKWLNHAIGNLLSTLGLESSSRLGGSVQFFIFDTIKILALLSLLIFLISYIQSYFPPERTKQILTRYKGISANLMGALLGTVTPFCSCSSIPLFIGFTNAGLPLGVTFSFLISSPLVDLGAFLLLTAIFGFKIALIYVVVGIILAVVGGTLIDKLDMEELVERYIKSSGNINTETPTLSKKERLIYAKSQTEETFKRVFWYVIIGVSIGALIHNWIPSSWITSLLGSGNPLSVLIATAIGIPIYADIFGTLPIAEALFAKGVELGTILAFMMAVTALSLPSMIMLKRVIKPKLLAIFVTIVAVGILIIGYLFNAISFLIL